MQFEWDKEKAASNLKKHGVSFAEAETVFGDSLARIFDDEEHSFEEQRLKAIGYSSAGKLLRVSFTLRSNRFRIFSVRDSARRERKKYEQD